MEIQGLDNLIIQENRPALATVERAIEQGQGEFSLILVRCNYASLQQQIWFFLKERSQLILQGKKIETPDYGLEYYLSSQGGSPDRNFGVIYLSDRITNPYTAIAQALKDHPLPIGDQLEGLFVFGLSENRYIDDSLAIINQTRDQFRVNFPFPVVLFVNDLVLQRLSRSASDFKSWSGSQPIKFVLNPEKLLFLWDQWEEAVIKELLENGVGDFLSNDDLPMMGNVRRELHLIKNDLLEFDQELSPQQQAFNYFLRARTFYYQGNFVGALQFYQRSLDLWETHTPGELPWEGTEENYDLLSAQLSQILQGHTPTIHGRSYTHYVFLGLLFFHMSLVIAQEMITHENKADHLPKLKKYLLWAWRAFLTVGDRHWGLEINLVLEEILCQCQEWERLEAMIVDTLSPLDPQGDAEAVCQKYSILAKLSLRQGQTAKSMQWAEKVLQLQGHSERFQHYKAHALFTMGQAHHKKHHRTQAIQAIESAKTILQNQERIMIQGKSNFFWIYADLLWQILDVLSQLHSEDKNYLLAFELRTQQKIFEQQTGIRQGFLGAYALPSPSKQLHSIPLRHNIQAVWWSKALAASGRYKDMNALLERFSRDDQKLTILHGPSGVGKSSLINAGLVPHLSQKIINAREVSVHVQNNYGQWDIQLLNHLNQGRQKLRPNFHGNDNPPSNLVQALRSNGDANLVTVIIFDQFEEFFFTVSNPEERYRMYDFLTACLQTPFTKVLLSLREGYLHHLFEWESLHELPAVNHNILDSNIRYPLGQLNPKEAKKLIQCLGNHRLSLEEGLVDTLVEDLGDHQGHVKPIELQVVGAQIEEDRVTTLQAYKALGEKPKTTLVQRFLKRVIADCGPENEVLVWQVLYSLTSEGDFRPILTISDLILRCQTQTMVMVTPQNSLDVLKEKLHLILTILVGSGLVFRVPDLQEPRYQLVQDYLASPIREEYRQYKDKLFNYQLEASQSQVVRLRKRWSQALQLGFIMGVCTLISAYMTLQAQAERSRAVKISHNASLMAQSEASDALFSNDQNFDALMEATQAAKKYQELTTTHGEDIIDGDTKFKVSSTLEQAIYGVQERNRFEGHGDMVWDVSYSPDGQYVASSSRDRTVRIWSAEGTFLYSLTGHDATVNTVVYSPDGLLASGSLDGTVRLWAPDGSIQGILRTNLQGVYSVAFANGGQTLFVGGENGVERWSVEGEKLTTWADAPQNINWLALSPDGKTLAIASEDSADLFLYDTQGQLQQTLKGHGDSLTMVEFSPNGEYLASSSYDNTARVWARNPQTQTVVPEAILVLDKHEQEVMGLTFSPDSQLLATAGGDNRILMWNLRGEVVDTFGGHQDKVHSVAFKPDQSQLISGSADKSIKLWQTEQQQRFALLEGEEQIQSAHFSPDGNWVVTAGRESTVNLWNRKGELVHSLIHDENTKRGVSEANFSPDGQVVAVAGFDGSISLWDTGNGELLTRLTDDVDGVFDVQWSPDGQFLATASRDQMVKIWSREGKLIQRLGGHEDRVNTLTFSPDGQLLISGSDDKKIIVWQRLPEDDPNEDGLLFQEKPRQTLMGHDNWILDLTFAPGGTMFASAAYDNTVKFWKISDRNGELQITLDRTFKGHTDSVSNVEFSPGGNLFATTTWDNQVQIWRFDDGTLLKTLTGHEQRVTHAEWSPDGQAIITASYDGNVILWNFDLENLLDQSCDWLQSYLQSSDKIQEQDRQLCDPNPEMAQSFPLQNFLTTGSDRDRLLPQS